MMRTKCPRSVVVTDKKPRSAIAATKLPTGRWRCKVAGAGDAPGDDFLLGIFHLGEGGRERVHTREQRSPGAATLCEEVWLIEKG